MTGPKKLYANARKKTGVFKYLEVIIKLRSTTELTL